MGRALLVTLKCDLDSPSPGASPLLRGQTQTKNTRWESDIFYNVVC